MAVFRNPFLLAKAKPLQLPTSTCFLSSKDTHTIRKNITAGHTPVTRSTINYITSISKSPSASQPLFRSSSYSFSSSASSPSLSPFKSRGKPSSKLLPPSFSPSLASSPGPLVSSSAPFSLPLSSFSLNSAVSSSVTPFVAATTLCGVSLMLSGGSVAKKEGYEAHRATSGSDCDSLSGNTAVDAEGQNYCCSLKALIDGSFSSAIKKSDKGYLENEDTRGEPSSIPSSIPVYSSSLENTLSSKPSALSELAESLGFSSVLLSITSSIMPYASLSLPCRAPCACMNLSEDCDRLQTDLSDGDVPHGGTSPRTDDGVHHDGDDGERVFRHDDQHQLHRSKKGLVHTSSGRPVQRIDTLSDETHDCGTTVDFAYVDENGGNWKMDKPQGPIQRLSTAQASLVKFLFGAAVGIGLGHSLRRVGRIIAAFFAINFCFTQILVILKWIKIQWNKIYDDIFRKNGKSLSSMTLEVSSLAVGLMGGGFCGFYYTTNFK